MPAAPTWRLLELEAGSPGWNMALDEALLVAGAIPTLRLYGWEQPALSLGVMQRVGEIPEDLLLGDPPVVRRITGGGAIRHREEELTFSVATSLSDPVVPRGIRESYAVLAAALREALRRTGLTTDEASSLAATRDRPFDCFAAVTELDVTAGGTKIAGAAQRRLRREGRLLEQVSVRREPEPLAAALVEAINDVLGVELQTGRITDAEQELAERLRRERYESDAWTRRR